MRNVLYFWLKLPSGQVAKVDLAIVGDWIVRDAVTLESGETVSFGMRELSEADRLAIRLEVYAYGKASGDRKVVA